MTIAIELAPEVERALQDEAQRRGVETAALAGEVLGDWAEKARDGANSTGNSGEKSSLTPRQQAVRSLRGRLAGSGRTVDDFLRERREEAEREMQATAARLELAQGKARAREAAQ